MVSLEGGCQKSALLGNSLAAYPTGTAGSVRGVEKRAVLRENRGCQPMRRALLLLYTMRLTVMSQMVKGIASEINRPQELEENEDVNVNTAAIEKSLERTKWFLWHGNVYRALEVIENLECRLESIEGSSERQRKLLKAVKEFGNYIGANQSFIPNYGDRYRHGETISTAFVESTVNYVVSKRMVKKQQMRWSERGAHLLLQVRTQVLNEDLQKTFHRWYPRMQIRSGESEQRKAA
jgi:hypothetical protein